MFAWPSSLEPRDMFYKVSDLSLWFGRSLVVPFVAVAVASLSAVLRQKFDVH
jgi:hypothetical protein